MTDSPLRNDRRAPPVGIRLLPKILVTRAVGHLAELPLAPALRDHAFGAFSRITGARPDEAAAPLSSFPTFNAFFTRKLRDGLRSWPTEPEIVGSPADGRLDEHGRIHDGRLIQAKGIEYRVETLLGHAESLPEFHDGYFATVYLSPADYHRVHLPVQAEIHEIRHIGGELWPVNHLSVPFVDGLFVRNERVVGRFTEPDGRRGAIVMVGATVVGRISVACGIPLSDSHGPTNRAIPLDPAWSCDRGAEFGTFHLGSTVVMVFEDPDRRMQIAPGVSRGSAVRLGRPLLVTEPASTGKQAPRKRRAKGGG